MAFFLRQIWTLTVKNLLIALVRHPFSTPFRAFLLPCIFVGFLAYARSLFIPPSRYGIGDTHAVRSLLDALNDAPGGRDRFALVNSGFTDGDIATWQILELDQEQDLVTECRNSIRGTSDCFAGIVFFSSPEEGPLGQWNYSLRADGGLQSGINVFSGDNDIQRVLLPVQHAVDSAISRIGNGTPLPNVVEEYIYTSMTQEQRNDQIRVRYMSGIINILAVAFFIGIVLITYQLTGLVATEREIGMAQLLDSMMPNTRRWEPQMARIIANHLAFDLIYAPGWIVMAIILSGGVFSRTNAGIVVINNILGGLAVSSFSILGASLFRRAQLSGISLVITLMLLAVVAQVVGKGSTGAVTILSLFFTPFTYVNFTIVMARWERQNQATNLVQAAPENPSTLPGIVLWVFFILQIVIYPLIGAWVERFLYGTASKERVVSVSDSSTAISLDRFTKRYPPTIGTQLWAKLTRKRAADVVAVNELSLTATRGEILVLLGANGSGKSTTLDSIAGLNSISSGSIAVNYLQQGAGLGLCPQKNVLWDELTVEEHVRIINKVKSKVIAPKRENRELLESCDIVSKIKAKAKTLSGGQKRKLQLALMFTGGSSICAVDEVSSGIDPLSRRKIWDILLSERGRRTIILTTHFLDEADLLADHIAILSKGLLKASGTSVALKHKLGSGYRVHVYKSARTAGPHVYQDYPHSQHDEQTTYLLPSSAETARFLTRLESDGMTEYQVSGPTIEDVFLKVADEVQSGHDELSTAPARESSDEKSAKHTTVGVTENRLNVPELLPGRRINLTGQLRILFQKRMTIFRRNALPYIAALLIPIIAAGLVTLFMNDYERPGCDPIEIAAQFDPSSLSTEGNYDILIGPSDAFSPGLIQMYAQSFTREGQESTGDNATRLAESVNLTNSLPEFKDIIEERYAK
ncbi:ABC transporter A family member 2 [Cyphellophora attinorum]|uniref:ABC transporter A family member 2 n=1 Tax=Cyphellophora attinorum TaxID=1664694 RepID=A0A0N1H650_9EURO|nr:ABC transporter A family member 2 [Phialophora attinorum]KPI36704.1 ABC transporter A family member 2 [Phialophora attinorum]